MTPAGVRWGIVGTGVMAGAFTEALSQIPGAEAVALASRDAGRAQARARELGVARGCTYAEMLAMPDVDVVYVATPNHRHRGDCLAAFAAGKAVLCEKPLGCSAEEAETIAEAARRHGVFCMEGMWTHFIPAVQRAEALLRDGAIGDPSFMVASFGTAVPVDPEGRLFSPALGGGALLDRGCYTISLALRFFGKVESVRGELVEAETGVDAMAAAVLRCAGGRVAVVASSLVAHHPNQITISGSRGRLTIHEPITRPMDLSIERVPAAASRSQGPGGRKAAILATLRKSRSFALIRSLLRRKRLHVPYAGNGYGHEIEEVHRCLREGRLESRTVPLSLSIDTMRVIDALRRPGPSQNSAASPGVARS